MCGHFQFPFWACVLSSPLERKRPKDPPKDAKDTLCFTGGPDAWETFWSLQDSSRLSAHKISETTSTVRKALLGVLSRPQLLLATMVCCCDTIGNLTRVIVAVVTAGGVSSTGRRRRRPLLKSVRSIPPISPLALCTVYKLLQVILQIFATLDCEFIKYQAIGVPDGLSRTIGLFVEHESNNNECPKLIFGSEDVLDDDPFFKTGRAMIILSLIAAACGGTLVMFEFFCCKVCCAVLLENLFFLGAMVTGSLTFLAYHNPYCDTIEEKAQEVLDEKSIITEANELFECTLGQGTVYNICAISLYMVAFVVLCCAPKPTPLIHQLRK